MNNRCQMNSRSQNVPSVICSHMSQMSMHHRKGKKLINIPRSHQTVDSSNQQRQKKRGKNKWKNHKCSKIASDRFHWQHRNLWLFLPNAYDRSVYDCLLLCKCQSNKINFIDEEILCLLSDDFKSEIKIYFTNSQENAHTISYKNSLFISCRDGKNSNSLLQCCSSLAFY